MKNRVYIEFDEHGRITKVDCDARHLPAVRVFIQRLSEKPDTEASPLETTAEWTSVDDLKRKMRQVRKDYLHIVVVDDITNKLGGEPRIRSVYVPKSRGYFKHDLDGATWIEIDTEEDEPDSD